MVYRDFDLLVERLGQGFCARVLDSPAGQASAEFALPFSDLELENALLKLGGRTTRVVRRLESTEMSTAKSFGAALFNAVFSGDVRACFRSSVDEAKRENTGIRVRLRLADPALADLPWEFLYNPSVNRFLALSVQTPLVRFMDLPDVLQPIAITPPIRVLVMISSPTDYPTLDVEGEWRRLNESLCDLIAAGTLSLERLDEATLPALQRRLRRAKYHIFHFIGHGEFDQTLQEGVLLLEREKHRGHRVGSQYLGMLLHDHDSLRVAVLNACEGARTSRQDPFAGTAQTLVQQGIPAVIAMQFEIADDVAGTFAHEFYGALADSYPIDAAVTEARKAIFAAGREVEWATPVLYLRAPDGRIFDVDASGRRVVAPAPDPRPDEVEPEPAMAQPPVAPLPPAAGEAPSPQEHAAALLRSAGVCLAMGDFNAAFEHLHQVRAIDPGSTTLAELTAMAEGQRAVADTRAQRRAAFRDHLEAAAALLAKSELAPAAQQIAEALRLRPNDEEAWALQGEIRKALDAARSRPAAVSERTEDHRRQGTPQGVYGAPPHAVPPARDAVPSGSGEGEQDDRRNAAIAQGGRGAAARLPGPAPDPAKDESDLIGS